MHNVQEAPATPERMPAQRVYSEARNYVTGALFAPKQARTEAAKLAHALDIESAIAAQLATLAAPAPQNPA